MPLSHHAERDTSADQHRQDSCAGGIQPPQNGTFGLGFGLWARGGGRLGHGLLRRDQSEVIRVHDAAKALGTTSSGQRTGGQEDSENQRDHLANRGVFHAFTVASGMYTGGNVL